ncbi:MAG: PAS domain-containing protein, partial [bacterium]
MPKCSKAPTELARLGTPERGRIDAQGMYLLRSGCKMISKSLKEACYRLLENYYGSALQESEARYGHLFENSPISLWEGDLTELNTYLQALRDKGITDLAAYLEQNPSSLCDCAKKAKVLDVNKAAVRLHNANSKEQLLGNLHKTLTQNSGAVLKEAIIAIAQRKNYFESETEVTTLTGELKHVLIRVSLSKHGKGSESSVKALVSVTDVTEHKQTERALRQSNQRLNRAQQVAGMGFLDWNLKTNELLCSDEIYQMYGIRRGETPTAEEFMQKVVHPDDLELVKKSLEQAVTGEAEYDIDHRVVRPDGQVIWVRAQAELIRDEDGNPETLLGTAVDIT